LAATSRALQTILDLTRTITQESEEVFTQVHQSVMLAVGRRKSVTEVYHGVHATLQAHIDGVKPW